MWTQCSNEGCGEKFEVENNKFGQMITCRKCGKDFRAMFCVEPADQKSKHSETGSTPLKRDEVKTPRFHYLKKYALNAGIYVK